MAQITLNGITQGLIGVATNVNTMFTEVYSYFQRILWLFNDQSSNYVLVLTDNGLKVRMNVATANTVTIPPNSSVAFAVGSTMRIRQIGVGVTTIAPGVGVTINSPSGILALSQYTECILMQESANVWSMVPIGASTNYLLTYSTTVTAGATTTLTAASNYNQYFTGTLNQIVVLPVVSTLSLGFCFNIVNLGTGVITIESSGGNQVLQLIQQNSTSPTVVLLTCIAITGTGIASWSYESGVMPSQSTTEYALTLTNNGVKQNYTISQQNVSVGTLASQNWSTGQVTLTGTQGTFAYDTSYVYFCIVSNTWIRLVIAMGATLVQQYINYITTPVTDSSGSPLSTATLNSDYPSALNGQRVWGIYYVYEFQGVNSTWVAISKINI
jgi:hypothetical protein